MTYDDVLSTILRLNCSYQITHKEQNCLSTILHWTMARVTEECFYAVSMDQ